MAYQCLGVCRLGPTVHAELGRRRPPPSTQHQQQLLHRRIERVLLRATNQQEDKQLEQKQKQQQPHRLNQDAAATTPAWVQQLQQNWDALDTPQKGYTVVVGLVLLGVLPRVLTLLVLGVERIIIGGLLAAEEVLLELLFRGGALVGAIGAIGLILAGIYLFLVPRATK